MYPVSLANSVKASGRGLSFFANRELLSALAPGVFIVAELAFLKLQLSSPSSAARALDYFRGLSGTVGLLLILVVSAIGYVIGYVARELAFNFLGVMEKLPFVRKKFGANTETRLDDYFDSRLVKECFKAHPFLRAKLQAAEKRGAAEKIDKDVRHRMAGGANVETRDYESFVYAKLWIKNFCSGFNIDSIELEINMLAATLLPSLLLAADILASVRVTWWAVCLAVILLGVTWWVLLRSLFRLRHTERWEAVRNLIMDYAMRSATTGYPVAAMVEEDPN